MKSIHNIPPVSGVYMIVNTVTNQLYIGSSVNMQKRCNAHNCLLANGKHTNVKLQRSYLKYGKTSFNFIVIEYVANAKTLIAREQFNIDNVKPYFNIRITCETNLGTKLSDLTRSKMSVSHKGKKLSEARIVALKKLHQNRIGKPVKGKVLESLKLGPLSMIGKPKSEKTKEKIRLAKIGKKFNKETKKYE